MTFKNRGIILFDKVLSVSREDRIPELIKEPEGFERVSAVLSASLKSAMDSINLRVGLNEDQIIEIACSIIDQSEEDYLAIEDVLLFLQELLLGRMGEIYNRMDMPTFFEKFEIYRQERHVALLRLREEQHIQNSILPVNDRFVEEAKKKEREANRGAIVEYLKTKANEPEANTTSTNEDVA